MPESIQTSLDLKVESECCLALNVSGDRVTRVGLDFVGDNNIQVWEDGNFDLAAGDRAAAYATMHQQVSTYVNLREIDRVVIKASGVPQQKATKALLESAEHRGVVIAAAAEACDNVELQSKGVASRTYGERNTGGYVSDDDFWVDQLDKKIRKGSRETAFMAIAFYENR